MKDIEKIEQLKQFVTIRIGLQSFGISVDSVVDILFPQQITPIPLAQKEVIGSLNLRGRIVTALDIRSLLAIDEILDSEHGMCVVIDYDNELFSLVVDKVGDVIKLPLNDLIENPDNLDATWKEMSLGIFPMQEELLVILDINKVMLALKGKS